MDSKEIERHGRDLAKAASTPGDTSDNIKSILSQLSKGVKASEDLLRSTKIGITVNKLRQHKNPEVQKQATELVTKWKRDVKGGATPARTGSPAVNGAVSKTEKKEASPAVAEGASTVKAEKENSVQNNWKPTVPPEQRSAKADGIDTKRTGNATRDNCLKLMYDGLAFNSKEPPSVLLPVAVAVEAAAFKNLQPETSAPYKEKIRSLFQNLKNKSNGGLRENVASGEITPERFVKMSPEELKSPERREEEARMNQQNLNDAMVATAEEAVSKTLQCGKCKERRVSYHQLQTRSADEPLTTFCKCLNCGKRWKFS